MKFEIKANLADALALFGILPPKKFLIYNLPANADGVVNASFESTLNEEKLKETISQMTKGNAMIKSLRLSSD